MTVGVFASYFLHFNMSFLTKKTPILTIFSGYNFFNQRLFFIFYNRK